jgi:hypothetical protein
MFTLLWLPEGVIIDAGLAREETALKQIEKEFILHALQWQ